MIEAVPPRTGLLDRVLEHWGIEPCGEQTRRELDQLHSAYLKSVPFENATKLLKAARTGLSPASIRGPVEFWDEHLRWGTGGTCFASTSAYQFLLRFLGFSSTLIFCQLPAERAESHCALVVATEDGPILVDVGYALPVPLPLPKGAGLRRKTAYYDLEIRRGPGEEYLLFSEDNRGQRFRYRFEPTPASEAAYQKAWGMTFRPEAPYMRRMALGRFVEGTRYLYKDPEVVFEITREGEQTRPLPEPPEETLSQLFGLPQALLEQASSTLKYLTRAT